MKDYFKIISEDLKNRSELIKEYFKIHPGENGRNKEDLLLSFLNAYLPKRYSLGTGFIIDTNNKTSNQNDVIIYDSFWSSILFPENVSQFYPIESVYGIIEVKSTLNETELVATIDKAKKIKKMPLKGIPKSPFDIGIKEPLYTIFAYDSIDLKTIRDHLESNYSETPLNERIDFIVVLNKGLFYSGNYFEIVKYGHPKSEFRKNLSEEDIKQIQTEFPNEIGGMSLNENTLLVWFMYLMTYLSFSTEKKSTWIDYLGENGEWGKKI